MISASAGTSRPFETARTIGNGAPRIVPTRSNSSSAEARTLAVTKSSGCDPIAKLTGRCSPRADRIPGTCAEVGHLREVRAHGRARAQHQPPAADVAPPGHRIDRVVDRRRDIRRAVILVLHMERQPHQVDGIAGQDHLLHRRVALRNFERPSVGSASGAPYSAPARARRRGRRRPPCAGGCRRRRRRSRNARPGILEQRRLRTRLR